LFFVLLLGFFFFFFFLWGGGFWGVRGWGVRVFFLGVWGGLPPKQGWGVLTACGGVLVVWGLLFFGGWWVFGWVWGGLVFVGCFFLGFGLTREIVVQPPLLPLLRIEKYVLLLVRPFFFWCGWRFFRVASPKADLSRLRQISFVSKNPNVYFMAPFLFPSLRITLVCAPLLAPGTFFNRSLNHLGMSFQLAGSQLTTTFCPNSCPSVPVPQCTHPFLVVISVVLFFFFLATCT